MGGPDDHSKPELSTLLESGTFYFALTVPHRSQYITTLKTQELDIRFCSHRRLRDPSFYEYLILADALRDGRNRERKIAEDELHRRFREASERFKS
jgi:hypothetical protein